MKAFVQFLGLVLFVAVGTFFSAAIGINPAVAASALTVTPFIAEAAGLNIAGSLFITSPDVSALTTYLGQYERKLFSTLVNSMDFVEKKQVFVAQNVSGKLRMTKLTANAKIRPYTSTQDFQGTAEYTERVLEILRGKSEFSIEMMRYRDTWMNEVLNGNIIPEQVPFAQYFFNEIFRSIGAQINDRTFYFGFDKTDAVAFDAGDTYDAGDYITYTISGVSHYYKCLATTTAGQDPEDTPAKWQEVNAEAIFPGIKYHIDAAITAGDLTEVSTGVVNSGATALAACLELFRSLDAPYKAMGVNLYLSHTDYEYLLDGIFDKYHQYSGNQNGTEGLLYLPNTDRKCALIPATWLNGSRRLIATPKENIVFGTNVLSDFNKVKMVESGLWTTSLGVAFEAGVQIRDLDAMAIGDQD